MRIRNKILYLHIMDKTNLYLSPETEVSAMTEKYLLCYSGDNEDYDYNDDFSW